MARESALWQRCRDAAKALRAAGNRVDVQRIENAVSSGHPDVEGCINGPGCFWIELKSCERPARPGTPIRAKVRQSQSDWHRDRTKAGCRVHWILLQVGEGHNATLYLIPGCLYDAMIAPESVLVTMSEVPPSATAGDALLKASTGW